MRAPNVTAGLTWPPDTCMLADTAANRANAWASASANSSPAEKAESW